MTATSLGVLAKFQKYALFFCVLVLVVMLSHLNMTKLVLNGFVPVSNNITSNNQTVHSISSREGKTTTLQKVITELSKCTVSH